MNKLKLETANIPKRYRGLGLGRRVKIFEIREVVQFGTKWKKFRKRPGIAITQIKHKALSWIVMSNMVIDLPHFYELTIYYEAFLYSQDKAKSQPY